MHETFLYWDRGLVPCPNHHPIKCIATGMAISPIIVPDITPNSTSDGKCTYRYIRENAMSDAHISAAAPHHGFMWKITTTHAKDDAE